MRSLLIAALVTGAFCAAFAFVVDAITDVLTMWQVIGVAAVSGFCGSIFASFILGRNR